MSKNTPEKLNRFTGRWRDCFDKSDRENMHAYLECCGWGWFARRMALSMPEVSFEVFCNGKIWATQSDNAVLRALTELVGSCSSVTYDLTGEEFMCKDFSGHQITCVCENVTDGGFIVKKFFANEEYVYQGQWHISVSSDAKEQTVMAMNTYKYINTGEEKRCDFTLVYDRVEGEG